LFDASTIECSTDGISHSDLAERTRQAYIFGKDTNDAECRVFVRCLRIGNAMTGAIGVEGLADPEMISPALPVLVAAALERALDWSPFLRQMVKTHFSLNGEL